MITDCFTLAAYRNLLDNFVTRGYRTTSFHEADAARPDLVLRHDIDQSLRSARAMADLETENGWRSTWFVLVRTEMYNPFSRASVADLRGLLAAGHEIGLHLDTTHYCSTDAIQVGAAIEARMLEDMIGTPIRILSFHRPSPADLDNDAPIAGRIHTYMSRFTRQMGYCSDSRGAWRHGHPMEHAAVKNGRALQLLTHAVWWVGPDGRDARGRLTDVLIERAAVLEEELARNNAVWQR